VRGPTTRKRFRCALALLTIVAAFGCASSPVTSARIETSIGRTFANLVHLQISWLGLPPTAASDFAVKASCRRLAGSSAGSGEWLCTLIWRSPQLQTLSDTYDLFVATDGCYTATVAGDSLGGPTLKASDGRDVRNLLYTFEGCFDTT
jgi:hypothetical protein